MSDNDKEPAGPALRDFRHSLPMELMKAREAAMARFRPLLRENGVTEQQWRVIRALAEFGPIDAGELARKSFLLAPSLTRILQYLENEKIIRRSIDANDQRKSVVSLSTRGQSLFQRIAPASEQLYAQIEAAFGEDRLQALYDLLADFYTTLEQQEA